VANTITYPANAESVASPVTFTGTASAGDIIELWDTAVVAATFFQDNGFQGNSFLFLGSQDANSKTATESDTAWASDAPPDKVLAAAYQPLADTAWASDGTPAKGMGATNTPPADTATAVEVVGAYKADLKPTLATDTANAVEVVGAYKADLTNPLATDTANAVEVVGAYKADLTNPLATDTAWASESTPATKLDVTNAPPEDTAWASDTQAMQLGATDTFAAGETDTAWAVEITGAYRAELSKPLATDTAWATDSEAYAKDAAATVAADTASATDTLAKTLFAAVAQSDTAWASDPQNGTALNIVNAITYPANAESVASPVIFTGTATPPGATVELWDTSLFVQIDAAVATEVLDSVKVANLYTRTQSDRADASDAEVYALSAPYRYASQSDSAVALDTLSGQAYTLLAAEAYALDIAQSESDVAYASDSERTANLPIYTDTARASDALAYALYATRTVSDVAVGTDAVLSLRVLRESITGTAKASEALAFLWEAVNSRTELDRSVATDAMEYTLAGDETSNASQKDSAAASDVMTWMIGPSTAGAQRLWLWNGSGWV
jgi:hypothetical protein